MINTTTPPGDMAEAVERLENCFKKIQLERMQGIPILNDAIGVSGVGFHAWQDFWLGVLISPWFINLVLLPTNNTQLSLPGVGKTLTFSFPSGHFTFIATYEEEIGPFLACSILSPVTEIATQELAHETAEEILIAIMDKKNSDGSGDIDNKQIERIWNGEILVAPGELSQPTAPIHSHEQAQDNSTIEGGKPPPLSTETTIGIPPEQDTPKSANAKQEAGLSSPSRRELFNRLLPPTSPAKVTSNNGGAQQ